MDQRFYSQNRQSLAAHIMHKDIMLFFSGEPVRNSADEDFPFFTNRNFL
jgi:Xaa-Pro aminopeptidase